MTDKGRAVVPRRRDIAFPIVISSLSGLGWTMDSGQGKKRPSQPPRGVKAGFPVAYWRQAENLGDALARFPYEFSEVQTTSRI